MEIIEIVVEYPSGMSITDRATFIRDLDAVAPSERLASILRVFSTTEAPPAVSATIDGASVRLDAQVDGSFAVSRQNATPGKLRSAFLPLNVGHSWSKDQRQQFGRYAHTLSAASVAGAVGYWHSTEVWTFAAAINIAALLALCVLLFLAGMASMNGE